MTGPLMRTCRRKKKTGRANDDKCGEQAEKTRSIIENEKQDKMIFTLVWACLILMFKIF